MSNDVRQEVVDNRIRMVLKCMHLKREEASLTPQPRSTNAEAFLHCPACNTGHSTARTIILLPEHQRISTVLHATMFLGTPWPIIFQTDDLVLKVYLYIARPIIYGFRSLLLCHKSKAGEVVGVLLLSCFVGLPCAREEVPPSRGSCATRDLISAGLNNDEHSIKHMTA